MPLSARFADILQQSGKNLVATCKENVVFFVNILYDSCLFARILRDLFKKGTGTFCMRMR